MLRLLTIRLEPTPFKLFNSNFLSLKKFFGYIIQDRKFPTPGEMVFAIEVERLVPTTLNCNDLHPSDSSTVESFARLHQG